MLTSLFVDQNCKFSRLTNFEIQIAPITNKHNFSAYHTDCFASFGNQKALLMSFKDDFVFPSVVKFPRVRAASQLWEIQFVL